MNDYTQTRVYFIPYCFFCESSQNIGNGVGLILEKERFHVDEASL